MHLIIWYDLSPCFVVRGLSGKKWYICESHRAVFNFRKFLYKTLLTKVINRLASGRRWQAYLLVLIMKFYKDT